MALVSVMSISVLFNDTVLRLVHSDGNNRVTEQVCAVGGIALTGDIRICQRKTNPSHSLSTASSTLTGLTFEELVS